MIQLYGFTVLRFYRLFLLTLQYIDTLCLYGFAVNFVYGKFLQIYQIYRFTLRKRHAQIVNLRIYRFTGRFSGTMEFTILRFYRFTARLSKRRALDPRLTHRHHRCRNFTGPLSIIIRLWSLQSSFGFV